MHPPPTPPGAHDAPVTSLDALRLESDRRLVRTTLVVMLVPTTLNVATDALIVGAGAAFTPFILLRTAFLIGLLGWIWRVRHVSSRRAFEWEVFAMAVAVGCAVVLLQALRPSDNMAIVRFAMLVVVGIYVVLPNRTVLQAVPAIALSLATSAILAFRPSSVSTADRVLVPMMLALANVMGVVVAQRRTALHANEARAWQAEHDARQSLERSLAELRVLRGVIPICSHCRKIRTDVGDWQQLEQYVMEHTAADFSHGVCPECTAAHYPEVAAQLRARDGAG